MNERIRLAFKDMLSSARKAIQYYNESHGRWREEEMRVDALVRRLEVVGEAAARVPVPDRADYPGIKWREAIGMRQHLAHGYDQVDLDIVEGVLTKELPELIIELERLLASD